VRHFSSATRRTFQPPFTWLANRSNKGIRWLGEMTPEMSQSTIEEGYAAGALEIIAADIQTDKNGDETTNYLIVKLPTKAARRKPVFEWFNELAQSSGFDPEEDWGQKELFVFLD
jgi:hypothetical protein